MRKIFCFIYMSYIIHCPKTTKPMDFSLQPPTAVFRAGFALAAVSGLSEPMGGLIAWGVVASSEDDMHGVIYGILFGMVAGFLVPKWPPKNGSVEIFVCLFVCLFFL